MTSNEPPTTNNQSPPLHAHPNRSHAFHTFRSLRISQDLQCQPDDDCRFPGMFTPRPFKRPRQRSDLYHPEPLGGHRKSRTIPAIRTFRFRVAASEATFFRRPPGVLADKIGKERRPEFRNQKRSSDKKLMGRSVFPSTARSARISPTTGTNLNPWPLKPQAIVTRF